MAGYYSSRSDQLWHLAQQLVDEESKFVPFAPQQEHGQRIQTKYNQLVSNLSCLGDIIAAMYEKEKLTLKELEQIQHLQSTPIRANEELLSIIARKPKDVFECFLSVIKDKNQLHLYQMLVSGDDTYNEANTADVSEHKDLIRRNYMWLSDKLDTEHGLISLLYEQKVLTAREREDFFCTKNTFRKSELLLGMLSKKSPEDFEKCLGALEDSGQGHLTNKFRKLKGSPGDPVTVPSAVSRLKRIDHKLQPEEVRKSRRKPVPVLSFSVPVLPCKLLPKAAQRLIPSSSLSKPVPPPKPGTQLTSAQHYAKSMDTVAKSIEETFNFRKTEGVKFQARFNGLESRLQKDFAIKVTNVFLSSMEKPEDSLKMCFHILLQECYQMRKEILARNIETNMDMEELRKSGIQYSATVKLIEAVRTQQKMTSEILRLEEKIDKLKTDFHNEKAKCKKFEEEKLQDNTCIMEMKDNLNKAEYDKLFLKQQMHELNNLLASTEHELQKTKENNFEESKSPQGTEVILSRIEMEKLKETCQILRKDNEIRNALEVQSLHLQEKNQDLLPQLTGKDRCLESGRNLDLTEEEKVGLNKPQKEKSLETEQIFKLQEEQECEAHRRQVLEDKLRGAIAQIQQLNRRLEDRKISLITQESLVIRTNHQFLVENIKSSRLIELLHERNCITDEERDHLNKQPFSFYRNDALLQWMRTIPFEEDIGQKVLECFRQAEQNFVVDLLEKGGVLIKSKISTKLTKEGLFAKTSTKNVTELTEKEAMVINKLNQPQGLSLSSGQKATLEVLCDDIVIAPYCHQEANGIVIWFWCQSINGERNLKRIYKSEILLEILTALFKEFSFDSASSASKLLVPTSITIFVCDFSKDGNELPEKYVSNLIAKIKTKAVREGGNSISGLTILDKELFVVSEKSSEVEVYDSIKLSFSRRLNLKELNDPKDIASCNRNKCLYIFNYKGSLGQSKDILRVDPSGKLIKKWKTGDDWGYGLSVTDESNVILTVHNKHKLNEYTPDGQLIRQINLSTDTDVRYPYHAIKLTNGHFVVSEGSSDDDLHRVCIVNADGKLINAFGRKRGSTIKQLNLPVHFCVDVNGCVMVADQGNRRILLMDSDLKFQRQILWKDVNDELRSPSRILLDESNDRMIVADNYDGRILIFQF